MEGVAKIQFEAEIVREYSMTPVPQELGKAKCEMELYTREADLSAGVGDIEWIVDFGEDQEPMVENIGVWWDENKVLEDYDGVFSLPKEAIKLLRKAGITVPKDFE